MNSIYRQARHSGMAAIALTMFTAVVLLAGTVRPAQAQNHPPAFFPYPSTFQINGIVNYGDLLGVQAAAVGDFNGDGKLDIVSIAGGVWEIDVALGNGDGTFQAPIVNTFSFPSNTSPYAMAVGDFHGDGKLDLAVWCTYAPGPYNELIIFLGNGNGTFTYSNTYTAPNAYANPGSNSLYVADFNGDGKLDLAALSPYCGPSSNWYPCVYVYLGKGDGTFQAGVSYSAYDPNHANEYNVYGMAVGDLNGDGKPDIAVTEGNGIAVLLNNGNGTFGAPTYYDSGVAGLTTEIGIAIGDVNGDKKNDIVATSSHSGDLVLFLNQGSGTFVSKGSIGNASSYISYLVSMADINGDKKLDLVVADWYGEIWTFYGKGDGTFTAGPVYPAQYWEQAPDNMILADFNGDGALDIFKPLEGETWDGQVILGRSDGTFQTNQAYGWNDNGFGYNLVTADFNGDGFPDLAYSGARSSNLTQPGFEVMLGSSHGVLGAPTFVPVAPVGCYEWTEWIATGDVNGDGKADIVATVGNNSSSGCPNNQVAVLTGQGNGKFNSPVYYSTGSTAQSYDVFLEDVNGDGKPDIVTSNADGTISVLLNKGNGTFGAAKLITSVASLNAHLNSLAFGDFNGNGKLDIAVATYWNTSDVYILLGNGDGTFQAPITVAAPAYTYALAAGDFDKDGKLDLLVTLEGDTGCSGPIYGSAAYAFFKGNGGGTFTPGPINCTGSDYPMYPLVGDFNGDGKLDAFIPMLSEDGKDPNPFGPALLEGNGDGTFTRIGQFYVGATSRGAVVADFNNDGTPDIAVLNADNYAIGDYVTFATVMFNSTQPVSISPLKMNYGFVAVGSSASKTVILTNNQTKTLPITSISFTGTNAGDFSQTSNCGTGRKAGWECTINVKFTPTVNAARSATLTIVDGAGTQTVALSSNNPKPVISSLSPSSVIAGSAGFTLTITGTYFVSGAVVKWAGSARTTTYVSPTEVTAVIKAADVAKAGTFAVTVTNPAPGGGSSTAVNFVVDNPAPTLTSISPSSATHGGPAFTLTATGTGYVASSAIEWNGAKLTTKYVSSTTLTATVPAADIATAGTASVTVVNPAPGGGTSASKTFTIK